MLIDQYNQVKRNVEEACRRAGRDPREVTIIAVSKTKPLSMIEELRKEKVMDFGENKVQELKEKYEQISWPVRWHLIGHLQTNKVKYIVDKVALIHSVDSVKLAKQIDKEAAKRDIKEVPILIQVNFAEEDTKFGFNASEVMEMVEEISTLPHVKIKGLMQIAPFVENPEENRVYFAAMKQLSVDIKEKNFDNVDMTILSMGMTNDYEIAVEEGSTMVRVGTGIFGERNYNIYRRKKMKGTVDKLLNFMKLTEDEEYDEEYDDEEEEDEKPEKFSLFKKKESVKDETEVVSQPLEQTREMKKRRFSSTTGGSKVVSMNGRGVEVYVIKPQDFAEAQTAADLLREGRTVVINLEGVELTVAQRSIDFIGGATYAINGSLQAVSSNIFIAAPDSIEVSGDLKNEIMNENIISPQLK